jgi:hypothetical protein
MATATAQITIESVSQWYWETTDGHRGRVPVVTMDERYEFSSIMDTERPTRQQIELREAIRRKISYRISREIGW